MIDSTAAKCAQHAERPARPEPCPRCGTFFCDECASESLTTCVVCERRLESGRYVAQVPFLGIAMMIHGAITLGVAVMMTLYGGFLAAAFQDLPEGGDDPASALLLPELLVGSMLGIGLVHVLPGLLQIIAGWQVRSYRGRVFGVLALATGLVTVISCYCAPTSIAMLLWGAVVLFSGDVAARFAVARPSGAAPPRPEPPPATTKPPDVLRGPDEPAEPDEPAGRDEPEA